jgi:hypothetical protein
MPKLRVRKLRAVALALANAKAASPLTPVTPSQEFNGAAKEFADAAKILADYNAAIGSATLGLPSRRSRRRHAQD